MRFVHYVTGREVQLGVVDEQTVVDISGARYQMGLEAGLRGDRLDRLVDHLAPRDLGDLLALGERGREVTAEALEWVHSLADADRVELRRRGVLTDLAQIRYAAPLSPHSQIYCVGYNYAAHGAEAGVAEPKFPELFMRTYGTVVGHLEPMVKPDVSDWYDFEGELAVVIGTPAHRVPLERALDYVGGYSCFNDGSVRDYQKNSPLPTAGKNFSASGAMGPWVVTADEIPDPQALQVTTRVDDETLQSARTEMVFGVAQLVSYISEFTYLQPGDVIATGTPAGIGFRRDPQRFLSPGNTVTIELSGIGVLQNAVVGEGAA